ncbi:MAG: class D beta-lactamase [Alphaproteobacteria bacterium 40-19]|nr:MAG: class D beta-lactamase [Alphaproteobacteria bacterium 40-19]
MKKIILTLSSFVLCAPWVSHGAFLVKEKGEVIISEGDCSTRYSPCSSFKIALALMGFDAEILKDEAHPQWPFKPEYDAFREAWKQDQTPNSWMKESCAWYSQVLTSKLGRKKFQDYVKAFEYGNQDLSGDKGKDNGLTYSWLSSSLEISSEEQALFLEKLLENKLPVSKKAHEMTRRICYVQDLPNGWKLYGKTGSGYLLNPDRTERLDLKHGWFIGWIEKGNQKIIFVHHIVDEQKEETHAGSRAKEQAKEKLLQLIEQVEKKGF